jgi:hypothetical protein
MRCTIVRVVVRVWHEETAEKGERYRDQSPKAERKKKGKTARGRAKKNFGRGRPVGTKKPQLGGGEIE